MSLKFDKVLEQVQRMGRFAAYRTQDLSERGQQALDLLDTASDFEEAARKIELVRLRDAGYRGAAPFEEDINARFDCPSAPRWATIIAVDGSQIYPDIHGAALYYLTNIAGFVYYHGSHELPEELCEPHLFYADSDVREEAGNGSVIKNTVVNARRTVQEIMTLTHYAYERRHYNNALLGILDGPLLWMVGPDINNSVKLEADYRGALVHFHDIHTNMRELHQHNACLIGYVDRHDSRFVIRLLHLLSLADEDVRRSIVETDGPFEGLTDDWLFSRVLRPGQRSAVMIQQSPRNKSYRLDTGLNYEIAFFYLNVGSVGRPHIARVEIPMWVAQLPEAVDEVHSLLVAQCELAGGYPYVLTRADELAVVGGQEKQQLNTLINIELLKNKQVVDSSPKQIGKGQARAGRRQHTAPSRRPNKEF